ncbi:unnamed protein product [Spirodela intermedia]|uniref:NmrA-like domain-containing protein n=1 Tax=Spirodela intermedia TaxID=51605 RepID=A0A7I8IHJ5_SPIIN|nr:unnamed protein product [Spirodela intermedia]CAA6657264.1 unnamed protein product [Spirodela intermedia]
MRVPTQNFLPLDTVRIFYISGPGYPGRSVFLCSTRTDQSPRTYSSRGGGLAGSTGEPTRIGRLALTDFYMEMQIERYKNTQCQWQKVAEGTRERERERERERQDCERRAVEETGIPFTYISAGCFAGYMAAVFVDEDDIATYAVMTINDPRAANKTVYIRPPENVLSQMNLVRLWEELIGRQLEKPRLSSDDFFSAMKGMPHQLRRGEEASELYREVPYRRMRDYLKRYL